MRKRLSQNVIEVTVTKRNVNQGKKQHNIKIKNLPEGCHLYKKTAN
jgi:Tfp pilus assembly major pilin PilA